MLSSAQGGKIQHSPNRVIRAAAYEKKPNRRCNTVQQNRGITERNEPVGLRCPIPASIPPTPSLRIRNEPNSPMQRMQQAHSIPATHPISTQPPCFLSDPGHWASQTRPPNATQRNINPANRAVLHAYPRTKVHKNAQQNSLDREPPRQPTEGPTTSHGGQVAAPAPPGGHTTDVPAVSSLRIRNEPNSPMQHMQHALPMPAGHPISTQPLCFPGDPSPLASQIQAPNATQCNINPPNRARVARRPAPQNRLDRIPSPTYRQNHQPPATNHQPRPGGLSVSESGKVASKASICVASQDS
jgi:hypothetical protein